MSRHLGLVLIALVILPGLAAQAAAPVATGFIDGQVTANGASMRYVVYVPRNYSPAQQWPVMMFLHGASAAGQDGRRPVIGALGWSLWQHLTWFPGLVLFPQQPSAGAWSGSNEALALLALEEVVAKYNGDRQRLYLTGIAAGGDGTWELAADHPELFAAALPVAGSGDAATLAPTLKALPIWAFHGGDDRVTSPRSDRAMVAALQAAGNPNIQYTEYPGIGHNCWDITYGDHKVIQWLLAQKR